MQFIYPQSILNPRLPDEMFQEEANALSNAGYAVSLINSERLLTAPAQLKLNDSKESVIYRGWMLSPVEYENFVLSVRNSGGLPLTLTASYLATHYLPSWYHLIFDLTPETVILSMDSDWTEELRKLGWSDFFVKDYVKSLKTSVGSFIQSPEEIRSVVSEMRKYRGTIEGGLCIRRVEDFLRETERRYFFIDSKPYASEPKAEIPDIVFECAQRIDSKFFSVDVIHRADGQLRIVEVGDGQVSDLVGWSVQRFADLWSNLR
jgi:ATP-grasp domain, R2K clade family 3